MKINSLLIIIINFLINNFSFAQNQAKIDSLKRILKDARKDTNEVKVLNEITKEYLNTASYQLALPYAQEALQKSEKLNFKKGIAVSSERMGVIFQYVGNYEKALNNFLNALKQWEEIGIKQKVIHSNYY